MSTASKMVVDRRRSTEHVEQAAGVHRARIVESLTEALDEEAGQAAGLLVDKVVGSLTKKTGGMVDADRIHTDELTDDGPAREERAAAAAELTDLLVKDRQTLTGLTGASYVQQIGFIGPTPDQPHLLLAFAETIARRLKERPAPKVAARGVSFDPVEWAKDYEAPIERLRVALQAVAKETHEAESTRTDKQHAMDAHDRAFSASASLLSVLLEIAGEKELARRIRPSHRRKGVAQGLEGGADTPEPTPAAGEEPVGKPVAKPEDVDS